MSYSANYRYSEITGANAVTLTETQLVVDLSYKQAGAKGILLSEAPLKESPSTISVSVGGTPYTETAITSGYPSGTNFTIEYSSNSGVIFLPTGTALGTSCTISYKGLGTVATIESKRYNPDGLVTAPSVSFESDTDSGFYRIGANNIGASVNGVKSLDIAPTAVGVFTSGIERHRITSTGFESVIAAGAILYPEFKCRAWVNFDGTGAIGSQTIRGSGNVSTVAKTATGTYTVNLISMPDALYSVGASIGNYGATSINQVINVSEYAISSFVVRSTTSTSGTATDMTVYSIGVFR